MKYLRLANINNVSSKLDIDMNLILNSQILREKIKFLQYFASHYITPYHVLSAFTSGSCCERKQRDEEREEWKEKRERERNFTALN